MSEVFLYLTTTGRKTGLPRRIEIWFVESAGAYYVVSEMRRRAGWVKNLEREPRASVTVGSRGAPESVAASTPVRARFIEPSTDPEVLARVSALMDGKYGWNDGLVVELAPEG